MAASVFASRIGPPYCPECTGCSSTRTCTSSVVLPRSDVVSEGMSADQLPESATMITSASNSSRCASMNGMKLGEPISSSPSMNTLILTLSSSPSAFNAPEWMAMPPQSSAEPRPNRRSPTCVATNGSVCHTLGSGTGCTSWCAYSSTVGASGSTMREPMTSQAPGVPSALCAWATLASMPTRRSSSATNSAERRICSPVMPSAEIDFNAILRSISSTMRGQSSSTRDRISSTFTDAMILLYIWGSWSSRA